MSGLCMKDGLLSFVLQRVLSSKAINLGCCVKAGQEANATLNPRRDV